MGEKKEIKTNTLHHGFALMAISQALVFIRSTHGAF